MPLSFRQRIFLVLVALTAVPTCLAVIGWALAVRADAPSAGARLSLDRVAVSARQVLERVDTLRLEPDERAALRHHLAEISSSVTLARRAATLLPPTTRRASCGGAGARRRGAVRIGARGRASVAAAVTSDRRASRMDAADPPAPSPPGRSSLARRPRVRRAPSGAAGAGGCDGSSPRARARVGAAAGISRGSAPRGARNQESADVHADCGGSTGAVGRSAGRADGNGR